MRDHGAMVAGVSKPVATFVLVAAATVLGLAGTDLLLPAIPSLPGALGGSAAQAQLVLAGFVAGAALGLLLFGELGARLDQPSLLAGSLASYCLLSGAAGIAPSLDVLVVLRVLQGVAGSAAAVFAPGMIRSAFGEARAVRMLGLLGSIEALIPALAPIAGAWLLTRFGWRASCNATAVLALLVAIAMFVCRPILPRVTAARRMDGGYAALLGNRVFMRYALSQALTLGGLLVFVFGAPAVIMGPMGGGLADFVAMQVVGIGFFILGANVAGRLSARYGTERMIIAGTALSAAGTLAILAYALGGGSGSHAPTVLVLLFVPMNLGLGLRGPPGFLQAVLASDGDDARGAALVILGVLTTAAGGTAVAAPMITAGLPALAAVSATASLGALLCLAALPRRMTP